MSPRTPRHVGQSRRDIATRLRERRVREETLLIDVASALARRTEAEAALSRANESLGDALSELEQLGFSVAEVAGLLSLDAAALNGSAASRRSAGRPTRAPEDPGNALGPVE